MVQQIPLEGEAHVVDLVEANVFFPSLGHPNLIIAWICQYSQDPTKGELLPVSNFRQDQIAFENVQYNILSKDVKKLSLFKQNAAG